MQNNTINKVSIDSGKLPRSRFNKSFDVNTTADWGSLQPSICQMMYPNTKNVVQTETLTRLAPMLAPTFGRINYKEYHQFVDIEDIFPPFPALMSQTAYNGDVSYIPKSVPRIPLCILSLYAFAGAKLSVYRANNDYTDGDNEQLYIHNVQADSASSAAVNDAQNAIWILGITSGFTSSTQTSSVNFLPFNFQGVVFNAYKLLTPNCVTWLRSMSTQQSSYNQLVKLLLPLGNPSGSVDEHSPLVCSFFRDVTPDFNPNINDAYSGDYVDIESADYVVPVSFTDSAHASYLYYFAFRFSNFGKRIRKALLGCGYQLDLNSREVVSLLPLMAYYKAYYDIFGITQNSNYQQTWLARLVQHMSFNNFADWCSRLFYSAEAGTTSLLNSQNLMKGFLLSLGDTWFTETTDYISAHQSKTSFASEGSSVTNQIIDIDKSILDFSANPPTGSTSPYTEGFVKQTNPFTALDVELLKRMYRWSNVNSVAGKQIADALRAQGYQSFVESCQSNFIGKTDYFINVSDVVSMSDTYDHSTKNGSILGEYGGKGIGYDQSNTFVYETDKFGYWIGMFCVVPVSGYNQGIDPTLVDTEKFDFYNPQFDGLGYQASSQSVVAVNSNFATIRELLSPQTFGLIPRMSEWKVSKNISNGDFSLKSTRNTYMPYCLDKEIPIGERLVFNRIESGQGISGKLFLRVLKIFKPEDLPSAGEFWRFVGRYPWIGTFDRIFANFDSTQLYERLQNMIESGLIDNYAPIYHTLDNFMIHQINHVTSYAPMKPIEESFGTDDDGSFDSSVVKA